MNDFMFDFRQSHADRLEDAGVIKFGERAYTMPKEEKSSMRSRIVRQVRLMLQKDGR